MAILTVYTKLLDKTLEGARVIDMGSTKPCQCYVLPYDEINSCKQELTGKFAFYILLGPSKPFCPHPAYVGQTNDFINRVADHKQKKEWWDTALVFVSKADEIYKSEVEYLEYLGWKTATEAKNYTIKNTKPIKEPKLSEDKKNDMELYFEDIMFLTKFYGCMLFEKTGFKTMEDLGAYTTFYLKVPKRSIEARVHYYPQSGKYILLKNSTISAFDTSCSKKAKKLREDLIADAELCKREGNIIRLLEDTNIPVESGRPSFVAEIITGTSMQGTTAFKTKENKTFHDIYPNV